VLVFSVYVWANEKLMPSKAYAVLAYFNIMQVPHKQLGMLISKMFTAK